MPFEIVYAEHPVSHKFHTHVYYELLYVLEGEVEMTIRRKQYTAKAGSLVFLNQFDEHATRVTKEPYRRYYLLIPPTQLKAFHNDVLLLSVFRLHGERFPYVLPTGEDRHRFDTYFSMLLDANRFGGTWKDERIEALMTLILTDAQSIRPDMFHSADELSFLPIQDILDELDRSFADTFSLDHLAKQYHVSAGCLSAHFKRCVGMSPMQYVTRRRLHHAEVLLLKTDQSVFNIASLCGYGDPSNFVKRFRRELGCTPLQYRHMERTGPAARMINYFSDGPGLESHG